MIEPLYDVFIELIGKDKVFYKEPMKNHTSFKIGGPADILVIPDKSKDIINIVKMCNEKDIPFMVIGNGTNLLVSDEGIRGVVIKICDNYSKFEVNDNKINAQAGLLLSELSQIACENSLSGFEFASGIPGTFGGAISMNAGAYGGEMKDVVVKTNYIDKYGVLKSVVGDEHLFGYRESIIQKEKGIVLDSTMSLKKDDKESIKGKINELKCKREDKQPLDLPSAGSVFKRPQGYFAGKLVQDAGLRGHRIGGAEVSLKHCGFIVNVNNATFDDVANLIKYIQKTVKAKFGVDLQTEIRIIGELNTVSNDERV